MYYERRLTDSFARLIKKNGILRWLFDYVKQNDELDFLIGKNNNKEWISIYRGLSRILSIVPYGTKHQYRVDAATAYKQVAKNKKINIYLKGDLTHLSASQLNILIACIKGNSKFNRYYENKKEGFYQNILSRRYGICGTSSDDFVVVDKEVVIGYKDKREKKKIYGPIRENYKRLQKIISAKNPSRYGKNIANKAIGNELDFLALTKDGSLLIVEYKHGTNTSGIYLSPLQIGLYYDLFKYFNDNTGLLNKSVFSMLKQKQDIGLIHPGWSAPSKIKRLIPVLIISEFNKRSRAETQFKEIMDIIKVEQNDRDFLREIQIYNYTSGFNLVPLNW